MLKYTAFALALIAAAAPVAAQNVAGTIFTVTTDADYGDPIHPYGYMNVTETPTVGMWGQGAEWIAARAEYLLGGSEQVSSATFSFVLNGSYGVQDYQSAAFLVQSYVANGLVELRDFTPLITGSFGYFVFNSTSVGTVASYDVTALVNEAISRGDTAFGMAMTNWQSPNAFASLGSLTLNITPAIPEPSTYAMLLGGLALLGLARKRR